MPEEFEVPVGPTEATVVKPVPKVPVGEKELPVAELVG